MKKKISYLWILPQLILSTIFLLGVSYGFIKSFLGENGLSLEHYQEIIPRFVQAALVTLRLSAWGVSLSLLLGLAVALVTSYRLQEKTRLFGRYEWNTGLSSMPCLCATT